MKLPAALLALLLTYSSASTNNYTTINFDTLPTTSGLGPLPFPHHHLSFHFYSVLNPHSPSLKNLISPRDTNCAISPPNALLGSRPCEDCTGAYFEIANATWMKDEGLEPWFTLVGFWIKPTDTPEPGTTIRVRGYKAGEEKAKEKGGGETEDTEETEALEWEVEFPSGFHDMFEVRIEEFSGMKWRRLRRVEVVADFGYGALDWEFCVDDLVVQFFEVEKEEEEEEEEEESGARIVGEQEVLNEEI